MKSATEYTVYTNHPSAGQGNKIKETVANGRAYNLELMKVIINPERFEDVGSILVDRLKKVEDTFDEIEYTQVVISGIERLYSR